MKFSILTVGLLLFCSVATASVSTELFDFGVNPKSEIPAITVSNAEVTKQQFAPFGQDSNLICDPETGECYTPEAWAAKNAQPVSNAFTPSENWTTYVGTISSGSTGSAVSYGSVGSRTVFYSGSVGSQQSYGSNGSGRMSFNRPGIVPRVTTRMVRVRVPCATCPSGFRWEMQPQTVNVYPVGSRSNYAQRWSVQGGNANLSNHMADHAAAGHSAPGQSLEEQHDAIHDQVGAGYMVGNQFVSTGGGNNQSAIRQTRQVMTFRGPVSYVRGQPVRNMAARLFPRIAARRGW